MSSFEEFINNLSQEQMELLQAALDKASSKPVAKIPTRELPSRSKTKQEETVSSKSPDITVNPDFTVIRNDNVNKGKTPVRARKNEWEDHGEFKDDEFDYQKFEKMKTPRKRQRPNQRTVECHVCGKSFTINENLIYGEYIRCNRCTGR